MVSEALIMILEGFPTACFPRERPVINTVLCPLRVLLISFRFLGPIPGYTTANQYPRLRHLEVKIAAVILEPGSPLCATRQPPISTRRGSTMFILSMRPLESKKQRSKMRGGLCSRYAPAAMASRLRLRFAQKGSLDLFCRRPLNRGTGSKVISFCLRLGVSSDFGCQALQLGIQRLRSAAVQSQLKLVNCKYEPNST